MKIINCQMYNNIYFLIINEYFSIIKTYKKINFYLQNFKKI